MRNRREFIALIGGAAGWPLAARAQPAVLPMVGFLNARAANTSDHLAAAFVRGLAESGYVEGRDVKVEYSWANGQYEQLSSMANDFVRRRVSVLVATGGEQAAIAAKAATTSIPIVFAVGSDPVSLGLVASYSHPGGNATGVNILTTTLETKRLGLLRDLVPQITKIGVLLNPDVPTASSQLNDVQNAARAMGLRIDVLRASTDEEIDAAFAFVAANRLPALTVTSNPFYASRRDKLVSLAGRLRAPTMFQLREYAVAGGLMSYGIDVPDAYRQVGAYAGRVLKGAKPADLPVVQPTKFELVINLKTAQSLGIKFSDDLLSLADEVIE
jgi:putative ABC transport system substrate-binding protein